jgi:prepilin-type N-terminal cleavage/methylation domain-containing protein
VPTDRSRAQSRPGEFARSRWLRLRARIDRTGDAGFTMVEMIVALVIIGIVMTALGSFFVTTVSATARQGTSQSAVQLADDGVEQARALQGVSVVNGRDCASSTTQWGSPVTGVAPYETDMTMACDSAAANGAGATASLPTTGKTTTVNGLTYTQNWYVGSCWQPIGGGACNTLATAPNPVNDPKSVYASFYRVVVAVTWSDSVCKDSQCVFIAATLISNGQYEPLFNAGQSAQGPVPVNPNDQTSDAGVPLKPLLLTSTGGAGTIIWTASGLPDPSTGPTAVAISSGGLISGVPTTPGTYSVTVTASDSFGLSNSAKFNWTIVAPPSISVTDQMSEAAVADSYQPTASGGAGALVWSSPNLPAGLGINSSTGLISGTPTTAGTYTGVTVTVTDGQGQAATKSLTWTVSSGIAIGAFAPPSTPTNVAISALSIGSTGGTGGNSWSATGLPTGLAISSSTGAITGTPTGPGVYTVTATVIDSAGGSASATASWTVWGITSPPSTIYSDTSTSVSVAPKMAFGPAADTYSWSAPTGAGTTNLPTGLSISSSTGVITGTTPNPTSATTYTFTLSVKDVTTNQTASLPMTWVISPSAIVTGPNTNQFSALNSTIAGFSATSANFSGNNLTWSWTSPAGASGLPPGISFDSSGNFSGSPTAAGVYTVTITAKKNSTTASQTFTWTVAPAPTATAPTGNRTSAKSTTIAVNATATGGTGTLVWSATGLPSGLSISAAGAITGTTASSGSTNNTVLTVTDQYGLTAKLSFTWTVS